MAPLALPRAVSGEHIRHISRSISSSLPSLNTRTANSKTAPLASLFAVLVRHASTTAPPTADSLLESSFVFPRSVPIEDIAIEKRQTIGILALPTTYTGLNAGPSPGAVVGIVLGSVAGFLLALFVLYSILNITGYIGNRRVEEEIITRRRSRSVSTRRRSRSHSETIEIRSDHPPSPPRPSRRGSRRVREETIVVEERVSRPASPVEDDIVEVIEEHSPERRPSKRMSGFRTVDPAEFGGGGRPMRKVSRK